MVEISKQEEAGVCWIAREDCYISIQRCTAMEEQNSMESTFVVFASNRPRNTELHAFILVVVCLPGPSSIQARKSA